MFLLFHEPIIVQVIHLLFCLRCSALEIIQSKQQFSKGTLSLSKMIFIKKQLFKINLSANPHKKK